MKSISRFYPVVPDVARLERMLKAGAWLVQLRIKDADSDWVHREIKRALMACRATGAQLVVNDHWKIAIDLGADFVHLGQEDLAQADLPSIRRQGMRVGISTHDHAELEAALAAQPSYVALGPIWPTTLKIMPWAPQGLARIGEWKRLVRHLPLVAIGGITLDRAADCLAAGADAVAVVNDVMNNPDPLHRAQAWLKATGGEA